MSRPTTLRSAGDLIAAGLIDAADAAAIQQVAARYAVAVTPAVAGLMDAADPDDPIARQYLPSPAELTSMAGELGDPIGDAAHSPIKGVVHRYPDRVLLTPVLACPVYCRFCFRRARVGQGESALSEAEIEAALGYVSARPELREVIVTGGDPLMLGAPRIAALLGRLSAIPHLEVVRFHSRIPVADPDRITEAMAAALRPPSGAALAVWLAVHVNHPRELSALARAAIARLVDAGLPLVSQTVLLKGINDSVDVLEDLMRALVRNRIRPYYLHHPDLAPGTSHFRPTVAEGRQLMRQLRGRLSGLAQPTYVLDIPGGLGKVPVGPDYWDGDGVMDSRGRRHPYRG